MTSVRCDEQMKRSKEEAGKGAQDIRRFRCKGKDHCDHCICGLIKLKDGTWEHVNLLSKRERKDD